MNILKIKRETIRPNPNAGKDYFIVERPASIIVKSYTPLSDKVELYPDFALEMPTGRPLLTYRGAYSAELVEKLREIEGVQEITVESNDKRVRTMNPQPDYLFERDYDSIMECDECHFEFKFSDTESDDEGDHFCPVCKEFLRFEYESAESAMASEPK